MKTGKYNIAIAGIILLSFAIGIYLYPQMPELMPSHWNAAGEVDGYMPKPLTLFLIPVISLALFGLFLLIPRIDPMKHNIAKFRKYFDRFILLLMGFFLYIYLLTILWAFGLTFQFIFAMVPAFSALFYYAGVLTENAKRNWFIGIRTPWTLSSEKVWDKTHKLGGKLFKLAAIIGLLGLLFQDYAIWIVIIPVIFVAVYTIFYSYLEFQKESKHK
ncbi:MAG: SdpI family protein [Candidatus Aenigmarchaeota archaeon]|nr:SdpI family protein [Candidatus Aenigmarchaeota archaeon]